MSKRKPPQPLRPHYSGNLSRGFWRRVNATDGNPSQSELYYAGVLLQEMEARVLRWLALAEQGKPQ